MVCAPFTRGVLSPEINSSARRTVLPSAGQELTQATVESNLLECRQGDDLSIRTFVYIYI